MTNHNKSPQAPNNSTERKPTANEAHLDNERILRTESTFQMLENPAEQVALETYLQETMSNGQIFDDDNARTDVIDPKLLKSAYWKLCRETINAPNAKTSGENIYSDTARLPNLSYSSVVVANHPHPEVFMSTMHDTFATDNPSATDAEKADFTKGLNQMALLLYGPRYVEYEEQRKDLDLLDTSAPEDAHEAHTREIDAEILGKSFRVMRTVREFALKRQNEYEHGKANAANLLSSPKAIILKRRMNAADNKLKRLQAGKIKTKQAKIDRAQERIDENPDSLFAGIRQRRVDKRQDKLDTYQQKFENKASDRKAAYENHQTLMTDRTQSAEAVAKTNEEIYRRDHLERYKSIKTTAIANRALRRELQGIPHKERQRRLAEFHEKATPEQVTRLARAAQIEQTAQDRLNTVLRRYDRAVDSADAYQEIAQQTAQDIDINDAAIEKFNRKVALAEKTDVRIQSKLDDINDKLQDLNPTDHGYDALIAEQLKQTEMMYVLRRQLKQARDTLQKLDTRGKNLRDQHADALSNEQQKQQQILELDKQREGADAARDARAGSFKRALDKTELK